MIYNSVADIFAANEDVRRRLVARVEGLGEARANASAGGWSVAQIVEHLSRTERGVARTLEKILSEAAGGDGDATRAFAPFSLDDYVERSRERKFEAPEFIRPRGLALTESLARLRESRAQLESLRPRFESADYSRQFAHPAFGMLNVGQWLAFVGMHEERHLRQIERTLGETMKEERGTMK
ncbi:MAG: DinB family protein [Acidobacteria bacterium]|nr:DinB family protein [Acidobacteriota bacterium]